MIVRVEKYHKIQITVALLKFNATQLMLKSSIPKILQNNPYKTSNDVMYWSLKSDNPGEYKKEDMDELFRFFSETDEHSFGAYTSFGFIDNHLNRYGSPKELGLFIKTVLCVPVE